MHTLTYTYINLHVLRSSVREHEYRKYTSMYILYRMYVLYMLYSTQHVHPHMTQESERYMKDYKEERERKAGG